MKSMEERFKETLDRVMTELGPDAFTCWFYCGAGEKNIKPRIQDIDQAFRSGFKDFYFSVLRYPVSTLLRNPENSVALEIGYGGGRLVHAASHLFEKVIGVDIHQYSDFVLSLLKSRHVENVYLYQSDGKTLPVDDQSVDFIYSFIVFVHLSSPMVLERYLSEISRILKPGGIASLYYGRPYSYRTRTSKNDLVKIAYSMIEPLAEFFILDLFGNGYRTFPNAEANGVSLMVSRRKMRKISKELGFEIVSQQNNRNWSQGLIVLRKEAKHER
jgi:ubiquinone/menaquinone biosynthesis C-methylase UbiE